MSISLRIAILLAALAAFCAVWAIGDILYRIIHRWQERYVREAESQMQEMLLQMSARQLLNYTLMGGGLVALILFGLVSMAGTEFNWRIGIIFAMVGFCGVVMLTRWILKFLKQRRLQAFNDQLEEALMSMSNSLKAGFSITQAIELVIRQKRYPISIEFRLMVQQTQLGMSFDNALNVMALRVGSEDFRLVASAISTARVTGGDLTGVFDRLAHLIRERLRIQRRVHSLSAQGRLQGMVLGALPLLLLGIMLVLDPPLIIGFFTQPIGIVMFVLVLLLEVGGFYTIRKIVNIDI